jgi:hypothetical protein
MHRHRFREHLETPAQPAAPVIQTGAFMVCPLMLVQGAPSFQLAIYQMAFEQAQAAVQAQRAELALVPSLN